MSPHEKSNAHSTQLGVTASIKERPYARWSAHSEHSREENGYDSQDLSSSKGLGTPVFTGIKPCSEVRSFEALIVCLTQGFLMVPKECTFAWELRR